MSFKDKPLKKIIADKRVTIDALHQGMSLEFITKRKQYEEDLEEKQKLKTSYVENPDEETKRRIDELEEKLKEYNPNDSVSYYLDTGEILNEYYSKKEETVENTEITVLDFMNKSKNKNGKKKIIWLITT